MARQRNVRLWQMRRKLLHRPVTIGARQYNITMMSAPVMHRAMGWVAGKLS